MSKSAVADARGFRDVWGGRGSYSNAEEEMVDFALRSGSVQDLALVFNEPCDYF